MRSLILVSLMTTTTVVQSITFMTYSNRANCPNKPESTIVLASKSCVAGRGEWSSSTYQCREKNVILTTYKNSYDCGLTPGNDTIIQTTEIALMDKCIKLGKGFVLYDCSQGHSSHHILSFVYIFLLAVVTIIVTI